MFAHREARLGVRHRRRLPTFAVLAVAFSCAIAGAAQEQTPTVGYKAIRGRETFRSFCSSCHGLKAEGDGRVAEYLTIKPADLTRISERNDGEYPSEMVHKVIDGREQVKGHGSVDMPVWGDVFQSKLATDSASGETPETRADRKIEELVAFIYSIQQDPKSVKEAESEKQEE